MRISDWSSDVCSSDLQGGQRRAYVIWTRLIRPDGASINLASPAISFDGTTGLEGQVNSNFFKRFGSALLLSVVGGLSTIASGGTSVVLGGAGQSAAAAAAEQGPEIGRAHVCTPVTNAHLVCRLLLEKKKQHTPNN